MNVDITGLSLSQKGEIASYIKRDHLEQVNAKLQPVKVKDTFYTRHGKRIIDLILGLLGFTISLPLNLVIAIVTFFDVGRPILFQQRRTGKNREKFTIYKFRNMTNDVDANGELLPSELRVTKWGKFVRKTSLDELLNFVSVLNGSMSIIGPRPLLDYYEERLNDRHKMMYAVRPGLECPLPYKVDHAVNWQERLDNYVWYAENCSLLVDVKLFFRMIAVTLDRKNTAVRAKAGNGGFLGYDADGNIIYTKTCPQCYVEEFCEKHGFASLEDAVASREKTTPALPAHNAAPQTQE